MLVVIKRPGLYADAKGSVRRYESGEGLETKEWYANSLVADGYAALAKEVVRTPLPVPDPKAVEQDEKPAEPEKHENWQRLPGIGKRLDAVLHEEGIHTQAQMLDALADTSLVNIVGPNLYAKIKHFYETQ